MCCRLESNPDASEAGALRNEERTESTEVRSDGNPKTQWQATKAYKIPQINPWRSTFFGSSLMKSVHNAPSEGLAAHDEQAPKPAQKGDLQYRYSDRWSSTTIRYSEEAGSSAPHGGSLKGNDERP
jgi:hypothetical protein